VQHRILHTHTMPTKKFISYAIWIILATALGTSFGMGIFIVSSNIKQTVTEKGDLATAQPIAGALASVYADQNIETDETELYPENKSVGESEPLEIFLPETNIKTTEKFYPEIGNISTPADGPILLSFVKRIHNQYELNGNETLDAQIYSPKSVQFSPDGKKVYVNSLESGKTLVYDANTKERIGQVSHRFAEKSSKPVESAFSHDGKYLWIPYYRFTDDIYSNLSSAVAVVDTAKEKIIKLIETGSVAKNVAVSPFNNYVAVTNWGENSVSLISTKTGNSNDFILEDTLAVGKPFSPDVSNGPVNRDRVCGACLRGILFSPDEKTLFVGLAGDGGGIAGFELPSKRFLGIIRKSGFGVRDIILSPDKKTVYISSINQSLFYRTELATLSKALYDAKGKNSVRPEIFESTPVSGVGRTVKITEDGKYVFMAIHNTAEIVAIDTKTFKVVSRIKTDPFTVGLDISKEGKEIWTTSQGVAGLGGGNAIDIFEVKYR